MNGKRIKEEVKEDLEDILKGDGKKLVEDAEKFAKYLSDGNRWGGKVLTASQIRNVFGEVKQMGDNYENERYKLQLLRPKLAYLIRHGKSASEFQEVLDKAIEKINNGEKLRHFKDFFEAIVAYHRKYGRE